MQQTTLRQRLRYRFDNFMARGGSSIFVSLMLVFLGLMVLIVVVRGAIFVALGAAETEREVGFLGQVYTIFLGMTDPGNMNQDVKSHWLYKVPAVMAGLSGVVILSALIAFITTEMDQRLQALKKGHSKVIEQDHTLILGWNSRVMEVLRELLIANESEDDPCVVILSEEDKEHMDDELAVHLPDTGNTRVVTRSGHVSSTVNLDIVSLQTCKSVIVLAYCADSAGPEKKDASDIRVIKTVLAAVAAKGDCELNIVAELFSPRARQIAEEISPDEVTTIDSQDILAKILVQTSRSVGLSVVYSEALSFAGCELYFHGAVWGDIDFGRAQFHFPDGVPMGIRRKSGELLINPPIDCRLEDGDDILILAEDDSTIEFRRKPVATAQPHTLKGGRLEHTIEKELVIGWNSKVPILVREYADYVLDGSIIDLMMAEATEEIRAEVDQLNEELSGRIKLRLIERDPMQSQSLRDVGPFNYDNIIILSQGGDSVDPETTDSETIVILLLIRQILQRNLGPAKRAKLITEVMDSSNQSLVARAGVHDFIISNRFVSSILAQISEDRDIKVVYDDLFSEDGSEIYLKPASLYFEDLPVDVSFADVMGIAQAREEVCIGVKVKAWEEDAERNFGVKLIPEKNTRYTLQPDDCLVVVAEDDG